MTVTEGEQRLSDDKASRVLPWLTLIGAGGAVLYTYAFGYTLGFYESLGLKPADAGVTEPELLGWTGQFIILGIAVYTVAAYILAATGAAQHRVMRRPRSTLRDAEACAPPNTALPFHLPASAYVLEAVSLVLLLWAYIYDSQETAIFAGALLVTALSIGRFYGGFFNYFLGTIAPVVLIIGALEWVLYYSSSRFSMLLAATLFATALIMYTLPHNGPIRWLGIWLPMLIIVLAISGADASLSAAAVKADKPMTSWLEANLGVNVEKVTITPSAGPVPGVVQTHTFLLLGSTNDGYTLWDVTAHKALRVPQNAVVLTEHGLL